MEKKRLVMVGNGMAGCRTLEELLRIAPEMYDITVFGAEPHPNYNRILLSPVLAGEMTIQDIILNDWDWYRDNGITLHTSKKIVKIDRTARKVIAEDGTEAEYDRLLLGRLPATADVVEWSGWRFEVVDLDGKRVDKVLVSALAPADDSPLPKD